MNRLQKYALVALGAVTLATSGCGSGQTTPTNMGIGVYRQENGDLDLRGYGPVTAQDLRQAAEIKFAQERATAEMNHRHSETMYKEGSKNQYKLERLDRDSPAKKENTNGTNPVDKNKEMWDEAMKN